MAPFTSERQPSLDVVEVEGAHLLLLGVEPHDGVVEQSQVTFHAIVALWRTHLDKLLRDINGIDFKIMDLHDIPRQIAAGENQAVARLKAKRLVIEFEIAMPLVAIGVAQITRKPFVAEVDQGVLYDDVLTDIHCRKDTINSAAQGFAFSIHFFCKVKALLFLQSTQTTHQVNNRRYADGSMPVGSPRPSLRSGALWPS